MRSSPPSRAELDAWHRRHAAGRRPDDDFGFYAGLLGSPGRVLELGAGSGRVAIPLTSRGHEVVALDLHLDALPPLGAPLSWVVADMAEFALHQRFELIVIADNTLQLLDDGDRAGCLRAVAEHLAPTGILAFEVADFQTDTTLDVVDDTPVAAAEGITLTAGFEHHQASRTTHYRRHFHGDGWRHDDEQAIRSLDRDEVGAALAGAGLTVRSIAASGYRLRVVAGPDPVN